MCRAAPENMLFSGMLESPAGLVEEWMLSPDFDAKLFCYFPCADLTPDLASQVRPPLVPQLLALPHCFIVAMSANVRKTIYILTKNMRGRKRSSCFTGLARVLGIPVIVCCHILCPPTTHMSEYEADIRCDNAERLKHVNLDATQSVTSIFSAAEG